jgi:hypothetical protein
MGGFSNPISTAGGILIRTLLQSVNFVAGVSGWRITKTGSAQFNDVTIVGNDLKVLGLNGSYVEIKSGSSAAEIDVEPGGGNVTPGTIIGGKTPSQEPLLTFTSPQQTLNAPNSRSSLTLQGANNVNNASFISGSADEIQMVGLAGTLGPGSAGVVLGAQQGSTAGVNVFAAASSIGMDGGGLSVANEICLNASNITIIDTTSIIKRGGDQVDPLHLQNEYKGNSTQTVTATTNALVAGTSASFNTVVANAKVTVRLTADVSINNAGTTSVCVLVVDGNTFTDEAHFGGAIGARCTAGQNYSFQVVTPGAHTIQMSTKCAGAGQSFTLNANHTKLCVEVFE